MQWVSRAVPHIGPKARRLAGYDIERIGKDPRLPTRNRSQQTYLDEA